MIEILRNEFSDEERVSLSTREATSSLTSSTRVDENELSDQQKQAFVDAVNELVSNGKYNDIVNIHGNMAHDMHGRNMMTGQFSRTGIQRFLAWHRAYLLEFEKLLKEVDSSISLPYWNWTKNERFPDWLGSVMPSGLVNRSGNTYNVERNIGADDALPDPNSTKLGMATHITFTDFTLFLEGWRPYGAHNQVHVFVGGTMGTMYSPADPVFWLHHAECDRLWHIWQLTHSEEHASLIGTSAIMDPWQYRYKDLAVISDLGYSYSSITVG